MATGFINLGNIGGVRDLTATSNDVRNGKTFSVNGKDIITGSMDLSKLTPDNIKKGVNIAGVVGNMEASLINYKVSDYQRLTKYTDVTIKNYIPYVHNTVLFKTGGRVKISAGIYFNGEDRVASGDNKLRIEINNNVLFYNDLRKHSDGDYSASYGFDVSVSKGDVVRVEYVGTGGLLHYEGRRGRLWMGVYYDLELGGFITQNDYDRLKPV